MCILTEKNEQIVKKSATFYAWRLVDGRKKNVMMVESDQLTKEEIKSFLKKGNVQFDGVDMVR